jgi:spore germination cell wall hydrolase CwlJ-like protein
MKLVSTLALSLCICSTLSNAGFGEINSVGDVRQLNNLSTVQSTVTNSPTWSAISKNAAYYIVEDKNAEAKALAILKAQQETNKHAEKAALKEEADQKVAKADNAKAEAKQKSKDHCTQSHDHENHKGTSENQCEVN